MPETTVRPWGNFTVLHDDEKMKVKILEISPGQKISLQFHRHRSESWVVAEGNARVELDGQVVHLRAGDTVWVPVGATHRLENPGAKPLRVVETQIGDYFGEDDIVRIEDKYGRTKPEFEKSVAAPEI